MHSVSDELDPAGKSGSEATDAKVKGKGFQVPGKKPTIPAPGGSVR